MRIVWIWAVRCHHKAKAIFTTQIARLLRLQVSDPHSGVNIVLPRSLDTSDSVRRGVCHDHRPHLQVVCASCTLRKNSLSENMLLGGRGVIKT